MTSQPRTLAGWIPNGAPVVGQAIRVKSLAPLVTEYYAGGVGAVASVAGKTGVVTLVTTDLTDWATALSTYAPLANPGFTGVPTAPTATFGTSTTQVATTAFVQSAVSGSVAGVSSWNTRTGAVSLTFADITGVFAAGSATPGMDGTGSAGAANTWSRSDHIHPSDTSKLALAGGTMTGALVLAADPAAPSQAATKNYVDNLTIDVGTY